jgi:hypothetical protein
VAANGPAHAGAREKLGLGLVGPPGRKGKFALFIFFFLFFICLFVFKLFEKI